MKRRRIAVVTGARADYGLLCPIISLIRKDPSLTLQLIVTGAHLEPRLGRTVTEIVADGFPIAASVPLNLCSDSAPAIASALGSGVSGFGKAYARLNPDILVVLGDRYEILAAVSAALPFKIPVAHLHGGEASEGVWDESIRHAVTKMSHVHFPAHPVYAARLRRMGENPKSIHCFGSPAVDRLRSLARLSRRDLESALGLQLEAPVGVVTYHPDTLDCDNGARNAKILFSTMSKIKATWIITAPNADAGGRALSSVIQNFIAGYRKGRARAFDSLGQLNYFSLLGRADLMAGNSSSGILEAPYFGLPVVNVGSRQHGRLRRDNVIDVPRPTPQSLARALRRALSGAFRKTAKSSSPRIGRQSPSRRIVEVLKKIPLDGSILKKRFHETIAAAKERA